MGGFVCVLEGYSKPELGDQPPPAGSPFTKRYQQRSTFNGLNERSQHICFRISSKI